MNIALFASSVAIFLIYVGSAMFLYHKRELETPTLSNHFPYELWVKKDQPQSYINLLLLISLALAATNFVLFAIYNYDIPNLVASFIAVFALFSIGSLFVLPLSKLREHASMSIFAITIGAIINIFLIYKEVRVWLINPDLLLLIPIIINSVAALFLVIFMFSPSLFRFNLDNNGDGTYSRPARFPLAIAEWASIGAILLSQISIVILDIVNI